MTWIQLILDRWPEIQSRLTEHLLFLTLVPVLLATLIGIPLGVIAHRNIQVRTGILAIVGITQTIPSLAMLALLLPFLGIGKPPAIAALTLYALLPITQNTLVGLSGTPASTLEAARGMGFNSRQSLFQIEIPLAFPVILGGIRTATVTCVGVATLSTFIGAGGLGDFISRGLSLNNISLLCLGAGSAAFVALGLDGMLEVLSQWSKPGRKTKISTLRKASIGLFLFLILSVYFYVPPQHRSPDFTSVSVPDDRPVIRVGGKNFTEQMILAELVSQQIENTTGYQVERQFNLGGTIICHNALINKEIDLYVEYSGTALTAILKREMRPEDFQSEKLIQRINDFYGQKFQCQFLDPLGFNNTYAIMVRESAGMQNGWSKISDLQNKASELRAGFNSEFSEREDGYPGLSKAYRVKFGSIQNLAPELIYPAIESGQVDLICGFSTDGKIPTYDLRILEDDRNFFPPYEAVPVVRMEILSQFPEIEEALRDLGGLINNSDIQWLNNQAEAGNQSIPEIVKDYLKGIQSGN